MKKQNRISGKADSVESGAQSKTEPVYTASLCCAEGEITALRATLGKEISFWETRVNEEHFLYFNGEQYSLAVEFLWEFTDGHRALLTAGGPLTNRDPSVRSDRGFVSMPMTHAQVAQWLDDNIIENLIPEDFHRNFRGDKRAGEAKAEPLYYLEALRAVANLKTTASAGEISAAIKKAVGK